MPEQLFDGSFLKKLEMLTLSAKQLFRGDTRGERRSSMHGASVEFADFRPYVQGDDFRRIDWNAFAKFESLMLRLFVEEQELPVHLVLDCSLSMNYGTPNKFDYARRLAAALSYIALANTDRVTLTTATVDEEKEQFVGPTTGPLRGKAGIMRLMETLSSLKTAGKTDLNASLSRFALRNTRAGLVIVISDLLADNGYEEGFKRIRYGKHELVIIQTLAPQEIVPELTGDVRLVDMETKGVVDISATRAVMQSYSKRLAEFLHEAQALAHRLGASYILANTSVNFEDFVLRQLRTMGLAK